MTWGKDELVEDDGGEFVGGANLGGKEATIGQGESDSLWTKMREAAHEAIFGSPDRAAARAAGIGLQPTPADMVETAGAGAAAMAGSAAMGAMALPGAAARVAGVASRLYGAYEGQKQGAKVGSVLSPEVGVLGRVVGGIGGAFLPEVAGQTLKAVIKSSRAAGAVAEAAQTAAEAAPKTVNAVKQVVKAASAGDKAWEAAKAARTLTAGGVTHVWDAAAKAWVPQAAEKAAEAAPKAATNVVKAITDPETLIARIKELREVQKLSGAQIATALKQWHGIPMKEATQAVKMVLGGS
jgi:hypothetical protein